MQVRLEPGILRGTVGAPPSKSMAHRMLICAALAEGESVVRPIELSEDILATSDGLRALGAEVAETPDGFSVRGGTVRGGVARANGDHRLAMSMALCGLRAPAQVTVEGAEILDESFPGFVPSLDSLRQEAR